MLTGPQCSLLQQYQQQFYRNTRVLRLPNRIMITAEITLNVLGKNWHRQSKTTALKRLLSQTSLICRSN